MLKPVILMALFFALIGCAHSESRQSVSCNSSSFRDYERKQCFTKKCLQRAMVISAFGHDVGEWMRMCMAVAGYSWPPSGSGSCTGPYCSYGAAWDYLPRSRQWRCRDTGGYRGGQFVNSSKCAGQQSVDNWP